MSLLELALLAKYFQRIELLLFGLHRQS